MVRTAGPDPRIIRPTASSCLTETVMRIKCGRYRAVESSVPTTSRWPKRWMESSPVSPSALSEPSSKILGYRLSAKDKWHPAYAGMVCYARGGARIR